MQLSPRYDPPPVVRVDDDTSDLRVPLLRQRRRMADELAGLDAAAWATPSRCDGWSVRDVVSHLTTTNGFWAASIGAGRAGEPTRFLEGFDPVATPAALVDGDAQGPDEVLAAFIATNDAIEAALAGLDDDGWQVLAEAPPGHVPLRAVVLHALWDAWVHERDVLVPLGREQVHEDDEVDGALRYAAALGPGFVALSGAGRTGAVVVHAQDPDREIVVELGPSAVVLRGGPAPADAHELVGDAAALADALSFRGPFPCELPEGGRWMFAGLAEAFDSSLEAELARHA